VQYAEAAPCASLSLSAPALGQTSPDAHAPARTLARHQVTIDIGMLTGGIAYGRRLGTGRMTVGGGIWAGWEPASSIDPAFFLPVGVELFVRSQLNPNVQLEAGPPVLHYFWADDCGECSGIFIGVRGAARVGHRFAMSDPACVWGGPRPQSSPTPSVSWWAWSSGCFSGGSGDDAPVPLVARGYAQPGAVAAGDGALLPERRRGPLRLPAPRPFARLAVSARGQDGALLARDPRRVLRREID